METYTAPTWDQLVDREPRIARLLDEARAVRDDGGETFCANRLWYGVAWDYGLKGTVEDLVGWDAETRDPVLRTNVAYDLVYQTVYKALPNCRNCACFGW